MAYTKTTTTSYGTRVSNSFKGIGTGFVLFIIGTCLLWWNEGNAVKNAKALEEAQGVAVHVDNVDDFDPSLVGQLIHATAQTQTDDELVDPEFAYSAQAIKLSRDVEYYQYVENSSSTTKDKLGGSQETTTTYTYKKKWTSRPVDSNDFEDPAYQGTNFTRIEFEDQHQIAENVSFGGYRLCQSLINSISGEVPAKLNIDETILRAWNANLSRQIDDPATARMAAEAARMAAETAEADDSTSTEDVVINDNRFPYVHVSKNVVYFGKDPKVPEIGDVRVTITQVNPGLASVIAKVNDTVLEPFVAKNKKRIGLIRMGNVSMEEMFAQQEQTNTMWLWVLRVIGTLLVIGGLKGIFDILSTVLKVLPFLSNIMNWGVGLICNIIGIAWSLIIIAIAWIFYRPVVGISILVIMGAIVGYFVYSGKNKKGAAAPAAEA